ncbi:MAG: hypothetical protein JNK82_00710 [Myxococcaceae bacterium]|nr:hypothetical protein [Myxococcaceae bacterium]
MKRALVLALAVAATACDRCSEKVSLTEARVRFDARALTLGPTWVGDAVEETVVIRSDSKQAISVRLDVEGPFTVAPSGVELPAGGSAGLTVRFPAARAGTFTGRLLAAGLDAEVQLTGIAEALGTCTATSACSTSAFDKAARACVATPAADGTACAVSNACMQSGTCQAGACRETPRSCPAPADACQTAFCDLETLPLMYVAARDSGEVTEVNLSTFCAGRRFSPGLSPQALVVSGDGSELFVDRVDRAHHRRGDGRDRRLRARAVARRGAAVHDARDLGQRRPHRSRLAHRARVSQHRRHAPARRLLVERPRRRHHQRGRLGRSGAVTLGVAWPPA